MRHLLSVLCLILVASACARPATALKPGDTVGDLVLATNTAGAAAIPLFAFCHGGSAYQLGEAAPERNTVACRVPAVPHVVIGPGWVTADARLRDANAAVMTTELYIDDQPVDLAAFGTFDGEIVAAARAANGQDVTPQTRQSNVMVLQPAPGTHSLRVVRRFSQDVSDGFVSYKAGRPYEDRYTVTFTTEPVGTPPVYWR